MTEYERLLKQAQEQVEDGNEKIRQTAQKYIPKLYQALRDEWHTPQQAKNRIMKDCATLWTKDAIRKLLPTECKNQKLVEAGRKGSKKLLEQKAGKIPASLAIDEPIAITNEGYTSYENDENIRIADVSSIRLPIKLNLRLYYPQISKCWQMEKETVTLIHNGSEVVEVDYLGK